MCLKVLSGWPWFVWSHWIYTITQLIRPSGIELNCVGQGGTGAHYTRVNTVNAFMGMLVIRYDNNGVKCP